MLSTPCKSEWKHGQTHRDSSGGAPVQLVEGFRVWSSVSRVAHPPLNKIF